MPPNVFAVALASMHQDMARLDRVALNLANASTPAYRREIVAAYPFAEVLDAAGRAAGAPGVLSADPAGAAATVQVLTDVRPGSLEVTGHPLDLALTGDAYFEVSTPGGPAYVRNGSFRLDAQGRLVTSHGYPVMGKGGEIVLTTLTPIIDAQGRIREPTATTGAAANDPAAVVAELKLVRLENGRAAQRMGEGVFAADEGVVDVPEGEALVRQGAVERSNVSSMQEMVRLLETMRHFESMQRVAQGYDEMLGNAIRRLGDLG